MSDREKFTTLVLYGMNPDEVIGSWAWNNFEEAKKINQFFDSFIGAIKS